MPGRPWAAPGQRSMLMLERSMLMLGAGDVMVGAGGASGPTQDIHHQPPGTTIFIYCNYGLNHNDAASIVVKAS